MNSEKRRLVITIVACTLVQLCGGIIYLWSVFRNPVTEYFSWKGDTVNMVSAFMLFGFVLGNLIGGFIQDRTNPRLVAIIGVAVMSLGIFLTSFLTPATVGLIFLTYCTLGGIGSGFSYSSVIACLQKWFTKRRGLASGIAVASFALSTVIFAPLLNWMLNLETFGTQALPRTFLIVSIVFFVIGSVSCIFISLPKNFVNLKRGKPQTQTASALAKSERNPQTVDVHNLTPRQALKNLPFLCIVFITFFGNATWNIILPLIKDLGEQERGLSIALAVLTVTLTGIANSGGRFLSAYASDKINRVYVLIALTFMTMLCALFMIFATGYYYIAVICITAFCYGGPASIFPALTAELCGTKHMGANYGIVLLGLGFSSIVFNYLSNLLHEATNSYTMSFVLAAATAAISIALLIVCGISMKRSSAHKK